MPSRFASESVRRDLRDMQTDTAPRAPNPAAAASGRVTAGHRTPGFVAGDEYGDGGGGGAAYGNDAAAAEGEQKGRNLHFCPQPCNCSYRCSYHGALYGRGGSVLMSACPSIPNTNHASGQPCKFIYWVLGYKMVDMVVTLPYSRLSLPYHPLKC